MPLILRKDDKMTSTKLQRIKANRDLYRKSKMKKIRAFPQTEADCQDEEDRRILRIARDCAAFCEKLDRAYANSRNSKLFFGSASFSRDAGVHSKVRKNFTRSERS